MQRSAAAVLVARSRCGRPLSIDEDTRDLTARRNILLGLWAARVLGIRPLERPAYAWSVHFADSKTRGDEDVITKLLRDFGDAGIGVPERQVRFALKAAELRAKFQLSAETC